MRTSFISLALLTAVLLGATAAFAGDEERSGSTGATELRIPVGARANAVGGAVVADVAGVDALYWNPAGIAHIEGSEAAYAYTSYFADMALNWVGFAGQMGGGHLGASIKLLDIGDIIVTTENAPDGTGEIISPTFAVVGVTYARALTDRVLVGGTMNVISERILQEQATGFGFDFGFQYLLGAQGLQFGLAIKNLGPKMEFSGGDLDETFIPGGSDPLSNPRTFTAQTSGFELPSYVSLGASYRVFEDAQNSLFVNGDFQSNSFSGDEFRGGGEYTYRAGSDGSTVLQLRGGYNQADQDDYLFSGMSFGAGLGFDVGDGSAKLEYARTFLNGDLSDYFDALDTLTLTYAF